MSQYKDFASIYDQLINSDIDYNAWADKILNICSSLSIEKRDYLDLACGTGNMTVNIAKHFKNTWAVDLSSQMLTEAESKFRASNLKAKFVCQDISSLKLNYKFDLITCCLDSTNYILKEEDLKNYFRGVYSHLKEDGVFIFDINSYYKLTEILGNNIFTYDNEDVTYIWENFLENDVVEMNLTFFVKSGELYRRFDEMHCERAYKEQYLEDFIIKAGFIIKDKLNNYENCNINAASERIVYVLTKSKEEKNV
ncbi:class I SAM-dependent methyltransferase [Clostridium sp. SYSU_GA19001]|uniref:class I SAM-dependent DNA methyltransferase n=1 Tax=Clostridium caldaquaticum TaxID=2940653 RepID=UPI0020778FC8|nr:class I SAM-dependent methyltransferase [Clostridium caldaquaticum]MCM8711986.1 class I SAM-dependent methyltransferase [Clostridium caldaquaticum]